MNSDKIYFCNSRLHLFSAAYIKLLFLSVMIASISVKAQTLGNRASILLKIDSLAEKAVLEGKTAGLSLTIAENGKIILSRGYGYADLRNSIPARPSTIYPIASITKQFTAVAILQLAEKGKLSLEDSLTKFLPGYPIKKGYHITVHQLLNHTSGIKNITSLGEKYWSQIGQAVTPEDLVKMFSSEPFDFSPGEDYSYSNSDYILLGLIIEKVSGQSYGDYIRENLFKPLQLKSTFYLPDIKDTTKLAKSYSHKDNSFVPAVYVNPTQGYSMGGICSNSEDLTRWLHLLHSGDIIGSSMYKKMISPELLKTGERISYGYGIGIGELAGHKLLFHAGGIFGADAQSIYFPDEKISIVILANTDDADVVGLEYNISKLLLGAGAANIPEVKLTKEEMKKYAGTYKFRTAEVKVFQNNDSLYIIGLWSNEPVRLIPIGDDSFTAEGEFEQLRFIKKENEITALRLEHYNARILEFSRTY